MTIDSSAYHELDAPHLELVPALEAPLIDTNGVSIATIYIDPERETLDQSDQMQARISELEFRATLAGIRRASMKFHGVTPTTRRYR